MMTTSRLSPDGSRQVISRPKAHARICCGVFVVITMRSFAVVVVVAACAFAQHVGAAVPAPPVWAPSFTVPINQTITFLGFVHNFQVHMYYGACST